MVPQKALACNSLAKSEVLWASAIERAWFGKSRLKKQGEQRNKLNAFH